MKSSILNDTSTSSKALGSNFPKCPAEYYTKNDQYCGWIGTLHTPPSRTEPRLCAGKMQLMDAFVTASVCFWCVPHPRFGELPLESTPCAPPKKLEVFYWFVAPISRWGLQNLSKSELMRCPNSGSLGNRPWVRIGSFWISKVYILLQLAGTTMAMLFARQLLEEHERSVSWWPCWVGCSHGEPKKTPGAGQLVDGRP